MNSKSKIMKRQTSVLVALLMILNIFAMGIPARAADSLAIAAWNYTTAPASAAVPASEPAGSSAVLENFASITPSCNASGLFISNWDNGANAKYWQLTVSTSGYENLTLAARTRSSGTGPRDFKVIYSVDNGVQWLEVPNSQYAIKSSTLTNFMPTLNLPSDASNAPQLKIRFIMTSNISSRAGTGTYSATDAVASGGTSSINNVVLSGTPAALPNKVAGINAVPGTNSSVKLGSKVALACDTADATIMYSINDGEYMQYNNADMIALNSLPATIKAFGKKDGFVDGVTGTFTYTQGVTEKVTATPNGGAIPLFKDVTLTCNTPDAKIKYSLDDGATYADYTAPIKLSTLPQTIKAYAVCDGLIDSPVATYNFTKKVDGQYNIYFGQIHSHTTISDGQGSIDDAYTHAKDVAKLDFLAVTDHSNSFDNASSCTMADGSKSTEWAMGHAAADKYTDGNFVGMYAYEMTWSNGTGHINTYNTPGFENRETAVYKAADGLKQYYNVLKNYPEGISELNHPGSTFGDFNDFGYYDQQIDQVVSLIEVGNGEGAVRSSGYFPSYDYYTRALDKGWHLSPTNNQDNHLGKWGDANTARTVVLADSLSRDNVYDAMRSMRTYATEDNNLRIKYTLNGDIMGTVMTEKPTEVNIKVDIEDPDNEAIGKVSVIANGGRVVASKLVSTGKDIVEFALQPDYAYYYIRVDEADKDIAVTAPVWIGAVEKAGISKTTASTTLPIKGEALKVTTSYFNNESTPMTINSLVFSINGNVINTAPALAAVNALGTGSYSFEYTPDMAGKFNVDVLMTAIVNGVEKSFTDVLKLDVIDPILVTKVVADGSHYNDYVNGYYANNLGNFTTIANAQKITVNIEKTKLTDELLKDVKLLIISGPAKKTGTANGVSYTPQVITDEDIAVVKKFVDNGGNLIICGIADYQDGTGVYQTSTQLNKLLAGIGATSRINNDQVIDNTNKLNNQNFRLAFDDYNMESPYLAGVQPGQNYSFYSGCSISLDEAALASGKTTWLVKGHDTTESVDSNKNLAGVALPKGSVYALAAENLSGGGKMFIGGTIYISDFEVKAQLDNSTQLQNSNYNIVMNILNSVKKVVPATPIAQVRLAQKGDAFGVEGIVTAGKDPSDNAFFDTLYIQDATGGINLFPISGTDIKIGQKVKAIGYVDEYQGDKELRVIEYSVTDTAVNPVEATLMTTKDAMDAKNGGMLVRIEGKVTSMDSQNIYVDDGSGIARAFVDGYIGDGSGDPAKLGKWDPMIWVGDKVSIIGLASVDPVGARLRVRNTSEIVRIKDTVPPVITISGIENNAFTNKDVVPVVNVDKGTFTMTLNNVNYNGETISAEGEYTLVVHAVSRDGYESTATLRFTIDKTAPVMTVKNIEANGMYNHPVSAQVEANEPATISMLMDGNLYNGEEVAVDGIHVFTANAIDRAGNTATVSVQFTLDQKAPVISVTGIEDNDIVLLNEARTIEWSASDAVSGVKSSSANINTGSLLDTSTPGDHTLTFTAEDVAGNISSKTIIYHVHYAYSNVLYPINNNGTSSFKLGSVAPVKFQLKDADRTFVIDAEARLFLTQLDKNGKPVGKEFAAVSAGNANKSNYFKYDSADNQYVFNMSTKNLKAGRYLLRIDLGDGSNNTVIITVK